MNAPTGYTALDLVGFTDKGTYNSSATYVKNDLVDYGQSKWQCLIDDTTNVTPVEGLNWHKWIEISDSYSPGDTAETALADGDYFPFYDTSASGKRKTLWSNIKSKLKTYFDTLYCTAISYVGTASRTTIEHQAFTIGSYTGTIDGSLHMQHDIALQTNAATSVTFEHSAITANSIIEVYAGRKTGDVSGAKNQFPYDSVYTTNGSCVVTFPAESSAITITVRIYIRG